MRIVAIIQARLGSVRLPGKVLKPLMGGTVLSHVINRMKASAKVDQIIVATTTLPSDDAIVEEVARCGAGCFRGSEPDLLERYYEAAMESGADIIVRITSDCPVIDPFIVDGVIQQLLDEKADFASNVLERSFPRGLDTEVFTMKALAECHSLTKTIDLREHVTPDMYRHPELFKQASYRNNIDYSQHRWTLDTIEDMVLINEIYQRLYKPGGIFLWRDILDMVERHPELAEINAHIEQKKV